ncbi:MAG: hypothetical protein KC517_09800 [Bacteroidetes bacterium]|jgi:hypothetical protein|nr:hypothetical protein [Bacteroidota bacterium]
MKVWIEKTIVKGRQDRLEGDLKLGKALWSPTKDKRGADIYSSMRDVREGDIVLHLTDNKGLTAISKVSKPYYEGNGAIGSDWEGSAYIIKLTSFTELNPPLNRTDHRPQGGNPGKCGIKFESEKKAQHEGFWSVGQSRGDWNVI